MKKFSLSKYPLVTIVIPTFNEIDYMPVCFDACYFQTYPNIEIIIVDGGSTDGTKEFLAQLENEIATKETSAVLLMDDKGEIVRKKCLTYHEDTHCVHPKRELKILSFPEDIGRTRTYNAGFEQATGEYCTYIVGDDIPHPHMIEELVYAIETNNVDVAYSDYNIVTNEGRVVRLMRKPDYDFEECFSKWFHIGVSRLHRTSLHERIGYMNESFRVANDYELYLRMAKAGASFHHVPKVLYSLRFHGFETKLDESIALALDARKFLGSLKK